MSVQSEMFHPMTSEDTGNAISSRGSESGVTRSDSPDGKTAAKSGPARVPASRSARPEKAKRSTTKGIFGQLGFHSSKHEDLAYALASRLRPLTDSLGSTLCKLTWMKLATRAGRWIYALRASELPTGGSGCIGWPTPRSVEAGHSTRNPDRAMDCKSRLEDTVFLVAWGTPAARDWKSGDASQETLDKNARPLSEQAVLAGWPTPDAQALGGNPTLLGQARLTAFGETPIGFLLGRNGWETVPASGQLSPAHSRWLMGLPREWDDCGVTAMESLRRSRRRS
ncbi:MAG TPA: hypothetical protein VJQ59_16905 [Candidatus Sulfotelmatobacter sp.]|nr:hypothetical protein [Candidatus Sulfotelmatobacter sp.]